MKFLGYLFGVALCVTAYGQNNIEGGTGWYGPLNAVLNGVTYDQVVLSGEEVTVHADPGQVVRVSVIDPSDDIVQVEMSGSGSLTVGVMLSPTPSFGITQPTGYLQNLAGTAGYTKGLLFVMVTGSAADTNLGIHSIGRSNGASSLFDATHQGGTTSGAFKGHVADVAAIFITGPSINAIRAGNAYVQSIAAPDTNVITRAVICGQGDYSYTTIIYRPEVDAGVVYQGRATFGLGSTFTQDNGAMVVAGGTFLKNTLFQGFAKINTQAGQDSNGNSLSRKDPRYNTYYYEFSTGTRLTPTVYYY